MSNSTGAPTPSRVLGPSSISAFVCAKTALGTPRRKLPLPRAGQRCTNGPRPCARPPSRPASFASRGTTGMHYVLGVCVPPGPGGCSCTWTTYSRRGRHGHGCRSVCWQGPVLLGAPRQRVPPRTGFIHRPSHHRRSLHCRLPPPRSAVPPRRPRCRCAALRRYAGGWPGPPPGGLLPWVRPFALPYLPMIPGCSAPPAPGRLWSMRGGSTSRTGLCLVSLSASDITATARRHPRSELARAAGCVLPCATSSRGCCLHPRCVPPARLSPVKDVPSGPGRGRP